MVKFENSARVKLLGSCWFESGTGIVPLYWYNAEDTNWFNQDNWFADSGHTIPAGGLPTASNNVYIVGTQVPIANLGLGSWVNPNAIYVGTIGIGLSGNSGQTIQTNFRGTGTVSISGNITVIDPT